MGKEHYVSLQSYDLSSTRIAISHFSLGPSKSIPYSEDPYFVIHKLIIGTHTSDGAPDFLMAADKDWKELDFVVGFVGLKEGKF